MRKNDLANATLRVSLLIAQPERQHPALATHGVATEKLRVTAQKHDINDEKLGAIARVDGALDARWRRATGGVVETEIARRMERLLGTNCNFGGRTVVCQLSVDLNDLEATGQLLGALQVLVQFGTVELEVEAQGQSGIPTKFEWDSTAGGNVPTVEQIVNGLEAQ